MSTGIEPQLVMFKNWTFRLHMPQEYSGRMLLLLHGWMGDENSMWMFVRNFSTDIMMVSPRGVVPVREGGYSWRTIQPGTWGMATLKELRPAAEGMVSFLDDWTTSIGMKVDQFEVMGFSQGAAFTYSLASLFPARIRRFAALSGFIPVDAQALFTPEQFSGKPVFISHGRQDEKIPIEQSRQAVRKLEAAGAKVSFCESDAGHKVSINCLKELEKFFR